MGIIHLTSCRTSKNSSTSSSTLKPLSDKTTTAKSNSQSTTMSVSASTERVQIEPTTTEMINHDSVMVSLLTDIKFLLSKAGNNNNNRKGDKGDSSNSVNALRKDMKDLSEDTQDTINSMMSSFETLSQKSSQNLELMQQSFSTLKLLVTVQAEQFKHFLRRLEMVEETVGSMQKDIKRLNGTLPQNTVSPTNNLSKVSNDSKNNPEDVPVPGNLPVRIELLRSEPLVEPKDIEKLNDAIDSRFQASNNTLKSIAAQVSELRRNVRNIRNDMDGIYDELAKKEDKETTNKIDRIKGTIGECSCSAIRTRFTEFTRDLQEQKTKNTLFMSKIQQIEEFKNETGPEKFSTALVVSRLGVIEKQIELIPALEVNVNSLQNITRQIIRSASLNASINPTGKKMNEMIIIRKLEGVL